MFDLCAQMFDLRTSLNARARFIAVFYAHTSSNQVVLVSKPNQVVLMSQSNKVVFSA